MEKMHVKLAAPPKIEIRDFSACEALQTHTLTQVFSSSLSTFKQPSQGWISLSQQAGCDQPHRSALDQSDCKFILKVR